MLVGQHKSQKRRTTLRQYCRTEGVLNCTTLPIVVSLDPQALSSNTGTGTSVAVAQRHRLSFAAAA